MEKNSGRWGAVVLLACVAVAASAVSNESRRYLQPKLLKELATANSLVESGQWDEAEARMDMVLMRAPVAISLDTKGMTLAEQLSAEKALNKAVALWQSEVGDAVSISIVPKAMANVRINWTAGQVAGGRCAGHAVWSRQVWSSGGQWRSEFSADIDLAMRGIDGEQLSDATLTQAAAHELGHVLGLDDSGRRGDLMGPVRPSQPVRGLSDREHDAYFDLRSEADALSNICALRRSALTW